MKSKKTVKSKKQTGMPASRSRISGSRKPGKRVTRRIVNSRGHTAGYVISGKTVSVEESVRMAAEGMLTGVRCVGRHLQAIPGCPPLANLPVTKRS